MGKLNDVTVRTAQAGEKVKTLWDGGGLYLEIKPTGVKGWRYKYQHQGRERRISIGPYPLISLKQARLERDKLKAKLHQGIDLQTERQALKAAVAAQESTLEVVAREWHLKHSPNWADTHGQTILRRLE